MGYRIKYQTFYYQVILNIINNKNINSYQDNSQLFVKLRILSDYRIYDFNVNDFYKFLNKYQYKTGKEEMKLFHYVNYQINQNIKIF